MQALRSLITRANIYYSEKQKLKQAPNHSCLLKAKNYIVKILTIFGVFENKSNNQDSLLPALQQMSVFRDNVRQLAIAKAEPNEILTLCDKLRDTDMIEHGVSLEDRDDGQPALLKLVDKNLLMSQKQEKLDKLAHQQKLKQEQQLLAQQQEQLRQEKARVKPIDLFKTGEYTVWDEQGIPLVESGGEQVTKSKRKKLVKEMENHKKLYAKYNP